MSDGCDCWRDRLPLPDQEAPSAGIKDDAPLHTDSVRLSMDNSGNLKLTRINVLLLSNPIRQTRNVDQYQASLLFIPFCLFSIYHVPFLNVMNVK